MPGEIDGLAFKLSTDPAVARNQREALARLRTQIVEMADRLTALGNEIAVMKVVNLGEFRVITPMLAVALYWQQFTTAWAIALFLDTAPLWWLLVLLIGASERTAADEALDEMENISARQMLLHKAIRQLLQADALDAKSIRALIAALLGQETKK